ncbi:hypothetical protein CYLTODRAFT_451902 [Cylindrobasidium torrendii FP15055 ss-10]|uniref:Uncharacterized protein n=1 Tax=Cylindrobasidium torrendii FP15055 ss-10 TaxID=1314674 RepID=A0A0D7BKU8_9AGAR|nr:hypothetical protein CYLTODRAFT_451902 [Cylindrobasidium torrendii FP15055 ss-10]
MPAPTDDLPWPELGNVSRGATRGNQGQKGVLGSPDKDGRCTLQLRVQPGVLAVKLNKDASDWYRTLDNEVNRALKMTKTYWRKARRRQDYDARADQDHMELHEWLQQLKDKTMSHLELLMQKGDIQGPPYIMSDELELTFMRKFMERQAAGIPHNPRLRNLGESSYPIRDDHSVDSGSPDLSEHGYGDHKVRAGVDCSDGSSYMNSSRNSHSPGIRSQESMSQEAVASKQALHISRTNLARAQKDTQDAFLRYTACLDAERHARQSVLSAEKRRDDIMSALLAYTQGPPFGGVDPRRGHSITPIDESQRYADSISRPGSKALDWPPEDGQSVYGDAAMTPMDVNGYDMHPQDWANSGGPEYRSSDLGIPPPRKRMHHMMSGFEVLTNAAMQMPPTPTFHQ